MNLLEKTLEYKTNNLIKLLKKQKYSFFCDDPNCNNLLIQRYADYEKTIKKKGVVLCHNCTSIASHPEYKNTVEYSENIEFKTTKTKYHFRCGSKGCNNIKFVTCDSYLKNPLCVKCNYPQWFELTQEFKNNKTYKGSEEKYNFICCRCGNIKFSTYNAFSKTKNLCNECAKHNTAPKLFKLTEEYKNGEMYKGAEVKYHFMCESDGCNNLLEVELGEYNRRQNKKCKSCTYPEVYKLTKEYLEGKPYINSETKYNIPCDSCGFYVYTQIRPNTKYYCKTCNSPEYFKETLEYANGEEYNNCKEKLSFKCNGEFCNNTSTPNYVVCTPSRRKLCKCKGCDFPESYKNSIEYSDGIPYKGYYDVKYHFKCCEEDCNNLIKSNLKVYVANDEKIRCKDCTPSYSKLEDSFKEFLNSLNINYIHSDWDTIAPLELDFTIPEHNLAIEMNGVFWHKQKVKGVLGGVSKKHHLMKTELCESNNINLIHITDNDWYSTRKNNILKSMIKGKLGINSRIFARKTKVIEVPLKQAQEFLKNNHLQGYADVKYKLGLEYENELIAIMTIGGSRFENKHYEIVRFASKLETNVVGGFSKLLKHFQRNFNKEQLPILSYADRSHSTGNVYKANNFKFVKFTDIGYSYFHKSNSGILEPRQNYQKHNIIKQFSVSQQEIDNNITEYQIMLNNGYYRIWDCGNSKWVLPYST